MVTRLVLGCDATGLSIVSELVSRQGELFVLEPDPGRVEQLRNEKVTAEQGAVGDPGAVRDLDIDPEEDPEEWLPELMQAAERLKRFESMLNDAPVEGDSFEDRVDGLLEKAKKYDQMVSVANE